MDGGFASSAMFDFLDSAQVEYLVAIARYEHLAGHPVRENSRCMVTNLTREAEAVYDIYRRRGDSENRIKELKLDLDLGRTSCSRLWANQLRVLLSAEAYVLMQEPRLGLRSAKHAAVEVETLRLMLLKIGGFP